MTIVWVKVFRIIHGFRILRLESILQPQNTKLKADYKSFFFRIANRVDL